MNYHVSYIADSDAWRWKMIKMGIKVGSPIWIVGLIMWLVS